MSQGLRWCRVVARCSLRWVRFVSRDGPPGARAELGVAVKALGDLWASLCPRSESPSVRVGGCLGNAVSVSHSTCSCWLARLLGELQGGSLVLQGALRCRALTLCRGSLLK